MLLTMPSWWKVASISDRTEKVATMAERRQTLVAEMNALAQRPNAGLGAGAFVVREVVHDRNRDLVGRSIDDIARERGCTHGDAVVDLALDENLGTWFIRASVAHDNSKAVGELLSHPFVHVGASDGGAHVGSFSTSGDTGYLFSEFVRGTRSLSLEAAVNKITLDPATIWGLEGRGLLASGHAADVVVFDADRIGRGPEIASDDFPGEGLRWIRRQEGVDSVVVNGAITWSAEHGYRADARAGRISTRPR
jgi:N-acyl-D-aspartate/D-glutamate deacylase